MFIVATVVCWDFSFGPYFVMQYLIKLNKTDLLFSNSVGSLFYEGSALPDYLVSFLVFQSCSWILRAGRFSWLFYFKCALVVVFYFSSWQCHGWVSGLSLWTFRGHIHLKFRYAVLSRNNRRKMYDVEF